MARLFVFGVQAEEFVKIKAAAAVLKLRAEAVPVFLYRQKAGVLAQSKLESLAEAVQMGAEEEIYRGELGSESMILMCGFSQKQMDKLLAALKRQEVKIDYKAVLTPTNAQWNVLRLFAELAREKAAYGKE